MSYVMLWTSIFELQASSGGRGEIRTFKKTAFSCGEQQSILKSTLLLPMREFNKPTFSLKNIFHQIVWKGAMIMVNITRET